MLISLLLVFALTGCASIFPELAAELRAQKNLPQTRQDYVNAHQELDASIKARILEGNVTLGMTQEQVIASWGKPHDINRSAGEWGVHEQWVYGRNAKGNITYLYFENGRLTSWQD